MLQSIRRDDGHGTARPGLAVQLCGQACALPDVVVIEFFDGIQLTGGIGAAVIGIALPMPQAHHFLRRVLGLALLNGLDGQVIAPHFLVVVHAVLGQHARKVIPLATLSQQQQPVVAQTVFLVSATPTL